jgi:hypothetical protein
MPNPTRASASPGSAASSSLPGGAVREPRRQPSRRPLSARVDRERRLRAEAGWRRLVSVCRREFVRRDAEPGRGR